MGRILAVDDDPLSLAVLMDALRALGHTPTGVPSGIAALECLERGSFELVIAEGAMSGMDGAALARGITERSGPPLVLIGQRRPELRGIVGYLAKPIDADSLGRLLDTLPGGPREGETDSWSGPAFLGRIRGPIERFPPARVLFLAHRLRASGAMRVTGLAGEGSEALVGLRGGRIVHVAGVPRLVAGLGDGATPDLAAAIGAAVAAGRPAHEVLEAAMEGLGAWLAGMLDASGGSVTFDSAWKPPPGAFPLPDPVSRVIALGLARGRPDALLARVWRALAPANVRLRLPDDSPESLWGIDATGMRVIRLAPKARTVDVLLRSAAGDDPVRRAEVLRSLDTLHVLGMLVVDGGVLEAPVSPARPGRAPDATQEDSRAARLSRALEGMERAHPVEVLELAGRIQLTEQDVANAYREISKRFHPDTYFNAPPAVRSLAETCFGRVNAAYDALRAPGGLAEAKRFLEAKGRGELFVSEKDHVAARVAFRRAEALFRTRDYKAADPLFQEAARLDAKAWPHAVYAAWCGWLARRLPAHHAIAALDAIKPPEPARAAEVLVHAGNVLKQEGRSTEALERYRAAVAKDPMNRDAQREVRLHELRNPTKPAGGLSGLLNRKKE